MGATPSPSFRGEQLGQLDHPLFLRLFVAPFTVKERILYRRLARGKPNRIDLDIPKRL